MTMKKILVFQKAVEIVLNRCVLKPTCSITMLELYCGPLWSVYDLIYDQTNFYTHLEGKRPVDFKSSSAKKWRLYNFSTKLY